MKKVLKLFLTLFLCAALFYIVYLNGRLYYQPHFEKAENIEINRDVLNQLHFLKREIHDGVADQMQGIYPEGFLLCMRFMV